MNTAPKPKSRIVIVISFVVLVVLSLMFLVYALVQRTEAVKMQQMAYEISKERDELVGKLIKSEERLKACENLK